MRNGNNDFITQDFEGFIDEQWYPFHKSIVTEPQVFKLNNHFPVKASEREIKHKKSLSYFDDYYNRIHIAPSSLELGNVASEQVSTVNLWNAYLVPKVLQSIDGLEEGIAVSGQDNPPLGFTALQERSWSVSILPDGPSTIDANVIWQFGTDQALLHNIGLAMIGWGAKTFALPIWNQQQWLKTAHSIGGLIVYCDTTHRNFRANRLAILRGQNAFDNETIEIESVLADRLILKRPLQKNWSKGTCLSPAVTAQMTSQPNMIKRTDRMMRTSVAFTVTEAVDHPKALPTTIYRNYPVLEEKPNEQNDLTHSYERLLAQLDNKTSFSLQKDLAQAAFSLYQYDWMTYGRVQQANLRALFYALRGSQKAIWLPTFSNDLTVKAVITASSQTFDIQWCGYTRFAQKQLGRQDVQIILRNKTVLYRRITSATEVNSTTERLGVDQAFTNQINVKDILNISFISLCRLSNDTLTFEHINDSDGIAKASVTWRGVRET
ncbi:hypothetical protein [Acinetobacter bereziniae]|uniref:hypothetical protein n=1 Tax=Acinetobacter bereziniae TaxID=106648 RepID=UPI000EF6ED6E|nr:hypothetical protein [Acinetobacter bereziniae]